MSQGRPHEVTQLLADASAGHGSAAEQLFPLVYDQLRALAGSYFQNQPPSHTLQPTALVHEAYLRLVGPGDTPVKDRAHFFALAARVMRQILVHHAREKGADKRGGGWRRITLDDAVTPCPDRTLDLIDLDDALGRLAALDERKARLVELRFFGGMSIGDAADVLGIVRSTAAEDWRFARAWLLRELQSSP